MKLTIRKFWMINELKKLINSNEKINLSALERKWKITRKTISKYKNIVLNNPEIEYEELKRKYSKPKTSFLENYENFFKERIDHYENYLNGSKPSILAIYRIFINHISKIKNKSYEETRKQINYSTFKKFLREKYKYTSFKKHISKISLKETLPGENVEIDWAENIKITFKDKSISYINILVIKLSFSRKISLHIIYDKKIQTTLKMIIFGLIKFKGVPKNLICDDMKSIIYKNNGYNKEPILTQEFKNFSKDFNINIKPCDPYTPQQKGKVESVVKIAKQIKAFSRLLESKEELIKQLHNIENEYNNSISNANGLKPNEVFQKEENKHLNSLPNEFVINSYINTVEYRRVKKDCTILFLSNFYYLSPNYINKDVEIWKENNTIFISYNNRIIKEYTHLKTYKHKYVDLSTQIEILKNQYTKENKKIDDLEIQR